MIVLDIDGTLLDDAGQISRRNVAALHAAQAAQIEVVFATGRRHSYAMQVLRQIGLSPERVLISSNGAVIRTLAAERLHSRAMTLDLSLALCRHLTPWRQSLVLTFDKVDATGEDSRGSLVVENLDALHASIDRWVRANQQYIESVNPLETALHAAAAPPIQMMLCGTLIAMREAMVVISSDSFPIRNSISVHRTEYVERNLGILDIMPKDCSKGVALEHLAAMRDIPLDAVMAIGDNWNDTAMLEVAGHAVVMDNASEELHSLARQRGWGRTANNNQHGLALAVERALGI
jgi:Cof subfamily protein (haloacid dehalogenase superfamily)